MCVCFFFSFVFLRKEKVKAKIIYPPWYIYIYKQTHFFFSPLNPSIIWSIQKCKTWKYLAIWYFCVSRLPIPPPYPFYPRAFSSREREKEREREATQYFDNYMRWSGDLLIWFLLSFFLYSNNAVLQFDTYTKNSQIVSVVLCRITNPFFFFSMTFDPRPFSPYIKFLVKFQVNRKRKKQNQHNKIIMLQNTC